jgi:hypothetical protein
LQAFFWSRNKNKLAVSNLDVEQFYVVKVAEQRVEADLGVKAFERFNVRRGKNSNVFQEGLSGDE